MAKSKAPAILAGQCPCGSTIMISPRYSISLSGPTTIRVKCKGYDCSRVNEVVIRASYTVERATWHISDCCCGLPIHVRGEYAGKGFKGYDVAGKTGWDMMIERKGDRKNRTVSHTCACGCARKYTIRFKTAKGETETTTTTRSVSVTGKACRSCSRKIREREAAEAS